VSRVSPRAGIDYPRSFADLLTWFPDDGACLDYLDWLRWPEGFCCPRCGPAVAWRYSDGRWFCSWCAHRVSATADTIFHGTRTPLTVWFAAAWHMTSEKNGISALGLKRELGIGAEQTAWAMLHRYRTAMVRPGRERLSGSVEVDETVLGGPEPGRRGRGALGKTLVEVGVERTGRSFGRCRLQVIENASSPVLRRFLLDHRERRMVRLRVSVRRRLPPRAVRYIRLWSRSSRTASRRPSRGRAGKALAARHPPGRREARPLAGVPRRVLLPLQPQTLARARHALLPPPRTGGSDRAPHLQIPRCCPWLEQEDDAGAPAGQASALRQLGGSAPRPAVAPGNP
jgi:hypothetical protein